MDNISSMSFVHYSHVPKDMWVWANFTPQEMADRQTGELVINVELMDFLQRVREESGVPMPVNSGYRIKSRDKYLNHNQGAADIGCSGNAAHAILKAAMRNGVQGIGIKQTGPHKDRFLHFDLLTNHLFIDVFLLEWQLA